MKLFKMCSQGNDFLLCDLTELAEQDSIKKFNLIKNKSHMLVDRNFAIGCDQIIIIAKYNLVDLKPINSNIDFFITFLNSDGSISSACGNGTRCATYYYAQKINFAKTAFRLQAIDRVLDCGFNTQNNTVSVNMGIVNTDNGDLKTLSTLKTENEIKDFVIKTIFNNLSVNISYNDILFANIGNPHCIIDLSKKLDIFTPFKNYLETNDIESYNKLIHQIKTAGKIIEGATDYFPSKINVEFCNLVQTQDGHDVFFIVYERGAGITLSCGSGASVVGFFYLNKYNNANKCNVFTTGCFLEARHFKNSPRPLTILQNNNKDIIMQGGYNIIGEVFIKSIND